MIFSTGYTVTSWLRNSIDPIKIGIPQTLTSGVDGFIVYDNHGGIALAQRYRDRTGWYPFAFYRFAAWDGEMTLTFAMSGLGTVKLDDVSVRTVSP